MRTIIDLPEHQVSALGEFCERERISRAEAIRRAVEALLESHSKRQRSEVFGAWSPRGDSRTLVENLREEWD